MRIGDSQLRLIGDGLQRFIAFTHHALFLHAWALPFGFPLSTLSSWRTVFYSLCAGRILWRWRSGDAVDLLRLAVDVFLLGVLAVVLLLELTAFFLRSAVVPLAGCAFGVAEACVCPEACASGVK
jgi:hypothetical protein